MAALPANAHISQHPCLWAKLTQLRSADADAARVKALVHEISTIVLVEALQSALGTTIDGQDRSPLGHAYHRRAVTPRRISVVPILRSGLSMVDACAALLPAPAPVHHLGLFREPVSLAPVEYYNNLPYHRPEPAPSASATDPRTAAAAAVAPEEHLAIVLDPVIATGGTAVAAVQTLREWGVTRVLLVSVLGSAAGVRRAAAEWPAATQVWVGGLDPECDARGMLVPGLGDIGDRLFGTKGK